MRYTPRPYQTLIIDWIQKHNRCDIWCFMGAGKTVSTLVALDQLSLVEDDVYPVLVVAPLRVAKTTWPEEVTKWDDLSHVRVVNITGNDSERRQRMRKPAEVYTINYELLDWLVSTRLLDWPFKTIILDESTKVKNLKVHERKLKSGKVTLMVAKTGATRANALARIAHTPTAGPKVKRIIKLTGTPAPNGLKDIWGPIWFTDFGKRLGRSKNGFLERWFRKSYDGYGYIPFDHSQKQIEDAVRDACLTIDAKDWFDVQEPIVINRYVELPESARKIYDEMERRMFVEFNANDKIEALNAAALTQKSMQIANGAVYLTEEETPGVKLEKRWKPLHDEKLLVLEEIIEEAGGMPVLVAYQFQSDLARLLAHFKQGKQLDKNPKTIADWNAGNIELLFAHPASAGHGLNLQYGGNILVYFGHGWNLEEREQILERIGPVRQLQAGFNRSVFVYNIIAKDTLDEVIIDRLKSKASVQQALLQAMKQRGEYV